MEYVIRHCESGKYLSLVKLRNEAVWVDLDKAHRFSDRQKVDNFMRMNFNNAVKGQIRESEVEILPCDTAHMPFDNSGTLRAEITEEQASVYLDTLPDMIGQMYETGRIMRVLLSYYSDQVRVADKAQEDMLHKIEFTNANVVDGFKLYKALQEIRQRRLCPGVCGAVHEEEICMTKKQIAALSNIIANENARLEERKSAVKPGIHAAWDKWIVTDGISAVLLAEKPDGLPEGEEMRKIYEMVEREVKRGDSVLACTATVEKIKEWKALVKPWKQGKDSKTGATPVEITARMEDGRAVTGYYNPWYLVNVVEAVGTNALVYIGYSVQFSKFPSLFVYPKDWMEHNPDRIGFLLSIRQ